MNYSIQRVPEGLVVKAGRAKNESQRTIGDERRQAGMLDPNRWRVQTLTISVSKSHTVKLSLLPPFLAARPKQVCDVLGLGRLPHHDETDSEQFVVSVETVRPVECGPYFEKVSPSLTGGK